MNLYEALLLRKSVRKYRMEPVDAMILDHIMYFSNKVNVYAEGIGVQFVLEENIEENKGIRGLNHVKAPYYLLVTSELKEDYLINAGYMAQQVVLYMTALNLGTCYQASLKLNMMTRSGLPYDYVYGIAFGKSDKDIFRAPEKAKRLPEESLVVYKEEVSDTMKKIVKGALLSPSYMNAQPWRLVVYNNRIHVFCKKGMLSNVLSDEKLFDIGVMLANLAQAADECWMDITFTKSDTVISKQFKNNEYITTVLLRDEMF